MKKENKREKRKKEENRKEDKKGSKLWALILIVIVLGGCGGGLAWYFLSGFQEPANLGRDSARIAKGPVEEQLLEAWEQGDFEAFIRVFEEEPDLPEGGDSKAGVQGVRYLSDEEMAEILGEEWLGKAGREEGEDATKETMPDLLAAMMRQGTMEIIGTTDTEIEIKLSVPDIEELAGQIEWSGNEGETEVLRLLVEKLEGGNWRMRENQLMVERQEGEGKGLIASYELLDAVYGGLFTLYGDAMNMYYQYLYQMTGGKLQ